MIWAVKAASLDAVKELGGTEITDESVVTTATVGRGKSTSQKLYGYETLTEAKDYSYYVLSEAPSCYMELNSDGSFSKTVGNTVTEEKLEDLRVQYGTNWGDVQIAPAAGAAGDKLVNAVAITAQDAIARKNVIRVRPVQESRTIDTETFEEPSSYKDGVYVGQAQGFGGPITVQVTISGGKITDIVITDASGETPEFLARAQSVVSVILQTGSPNVDTVSGATFSSSGLICAAEEALSGCRNQ